MKRGGVLLALILLAGCASVMPTVVALPPAVGSGGPAEILLDLELSLVRPPDWTLVDHSPGAYEWLGSNAHQPAQITLVGEEQYPHSPDEAVLAAVRLTGVENPAPATSFAVAGQLGRKSSGVADRTRIVALAWTTPARTYLLLARWQNPADAAAVSSLIASLKPLKAWTPPAAR